MADTNIISTNFGSLTPNEKKVWSNDVWKGARQNSFILQMAGTGPNAPIQKVTELTKSSKGTKAEITIIADLSGDGVVGDYTLEGNEESIKASAQEITLDQLRNANVSAGRFAEQQTVVRFRETSRDVLAFWLADRYDQLASLTLNGVDYRLNTDGSLRPGYTHNGTAWSARDTGAAPMGQHLFDLDFAADVTAPSANRHFRWDATTGLEAADVTAIESADLPSYDMLVELKARAKNRRIRGVRGGGMEVYHVLMHPLALAKLKLDTNFIENVRHAGSRGGSNPLFSGSLVTVDGLVIHEFVHAFNTLGAADITAATQEGDPGYKWGTDVATVDGSRVVLMGAQALAMVDLGAPEWYEDEFDYGNKPGVSISKMGGFLKPKARNIYDGTDEDFGVMVCDVAI